MGLSLTLWASHPMRVARQSKACHLCLGRVAGVAVAQRHFRRLLGPADSRGNRRFGKLHILGNTHEGTKRRHFAKIVKPQNPAAACLMFRPSSFPPAYTPGRWKEPETAKTPVRIVAMDWLNPDRALSVLCRARSGGYALSFSSMRFE